MISRIRCTRTLHAACQNFSLKYFHEQLKIRNIKDPQKILHYMYMVLYLPLACKEPHLYKVVYL